MNIITIASTDNTPRETQGWAAIVRAPRLAPQWYSGTEGRSCQIEALVLASLEGLRYCPRGQPVEIRVSVPSFAKFCHEGRLDDAAYGGLTTPCYVYTDALRALRREITTNGVVVRAHTEADWDILARELVTEAMRVPIREAG